MTAELQEIIITSSGEKTGAAATSPTLRKPAANPQQGMADLAAPSVGATCATTACTSPLTITSLEAAAANAMTNDGVPQVVSQVVPVVHPEPVVAVPSVEAMLAPMANLGLNTFPQPPPLDEERKMRMMRTPPTEHDNRKLFVGGLPTDVSDHGFLQFFQQFGEIIDSVVMVDRMTKRSRGFGFVTFANEQDANILLTTIPGKTGYVVINGKQCEVKASTPKVGDGPGRNHHSHRGGSTGMWKSHPPRGNRGGYHQHGHQNNDHTHGQVNHHQPHGQKNFYIDNEFNGDVDARNFDHVQQYGAQAQMNASYATGPSMYHQNYQQVYHAAPINGYAAYSNTPNGARVPSSWEASYPTAPNQGYGQYPQNSAAMQGNSGYYDHYAHVQYPNQYGGANSMAAHQGYNGYSEGGGGGSAGSGFEPYPQSYNEDGDNQRYDSSQYE